MDFPSLYGPPSCREYLHKEASSKSQSSFYFCRLSMTYKRRGERFVTAFSTQCFNRRGVGGDSALSDYRPLTTPR